MKDKKPKPAKAAPVVKHRHDPARTLANKERRIAKDKRLKAAAAAKRRALPDKQLRQLVESPNFDARWVPDAAAVVAAYYGDGPNPFRGAWYRLMHGLQFMNLRDPGKSRYGTCDLSKPATRE